MRSVLDTGQDDIPRVVWRQVDLVALSPDKALGTLPAKYTNERGKVKFGRDFARQSLANSASPDSDRDFFASFHMFRGHKSPYA